MAKTVRIPDRTRFETAYEGGNQPPWNIPHPQKQLVEVADRISGTLLDSGCGTGENALFFASRGVKVTGIDFIAEAVEQAKRKAKERGIDVEFLVKDALTLSGWDRQFDNIIDSGVFHVFSDEDRARYVEGLAHVLKSGGHYYMIVFSDAEPGTHGPRRISKQEILNAFTNGWTIESLVPSRYEVRKEAQGEVFSEGGAKAWLAVIRKN